MPYYPPQYPPQPDKPENPPRKRNVLRRIILCVSMLLIGYGAVRLWGYVSDLVSLRRTTQELREIAEAADSTETAADAPEAGSAAPAAAASVAAASTAAASSEMPPAEEVSAESVTAEKASAESVSTEEVPALSDKLPVVEYPNGYNLVPRIQKLRKKSKHIIGWITMDDLDEPVAQKDNVLFLNHDAAGKRNSNGALFMDEDTSLLTRPYTILVYGHNMKSGAMFGNLRKYEEFSYCYRHRLFRFDTLYEEGQYVIFAVETISMTPGKARYINLTELESSDRAVRRNALKTLMNHSVHEVIQDVNEEDQILLLVTCVGDDDERLVVAARRLRDGEETNRPVKGNKNR